jgi:hypothetical protein
MLYRLGGTSPRVFPVQMFIVGKKVHTQIVQHILNKVIAWLPLKLVCRMVPWKVSDRIVEYRLMDFLLHQNLICYWVTLLSSTRISGRNS